ncbi:PspC domain-containing protein [Ideonella sp. BN130291]|uniref:PspC domain-containing protein n=1 Tax=Ideonella sp. BN130291 TaxID=3112940 RepID=UPI002E25FBEB|nr:PspC domain-containing protein [Ideonella sp. BN130291]
MSLTDELARLGELHQRGQLSDDEFMRAKQRVLGTAGEPADPPPAVAAVNALRRSRGDRWLGGVCGGLSLATGIAAWMWRLLFTLLALCAGTGVGLYLLLWIFVPEEGVPAAANDGAQMQAR